MKLQTKELCKSYGQSVILNQIDLAAETGQSISISGPSGCGKSTLMSIMGLLLRPDSGGLWLDGQQISDWSDKQKSALRRRRFGFIFQSAQLIGSSTVLENVMIPAVLSRDRGRKARACQLLEQFGLADRMDYYPHQLSFGQTRRVSVARALLMEPDFVFADEPTNDLDEANAWEIGKILLDLPRQGKALILTTHDKAFAAKADRRFVFDKQGALLSVENE